MYTLAILKSTIYKIQHYYIIAHSLPFTTLLKLFTTLSLVLYLSTGG